MLTQAEVRNGDLSQMCCPMLDDFNAALHHRKGERPANGFIRKLFYAIYIHLHRKVKIGERWMWFIPIKDALPPAINGIDVCKMDLAKAMIEQQHPTIRQVVTGFTLFGQVE